MSVLPALFLVLARSIAALLVAPHVARITVAPLVRLGIAAALAACAAPSAVSAVFAELMPADSDALGIEASTLTSTAFALQLFRELAIGSAFGVAAGLPLRAVLWSARIVDAALPNSGGAAAATMLADTRTQHDASPVSQLVFLVGAALWFASGFHLALVETFAQTFDIAPLAGRFVVDASTLANGAAKLVASAFAVSVAIAFPVLVLLLLAQLSVAVASRAAGSTRVPALSEPFLRIALLLGLALLITVLLPNASELYLPALRDALSIVRTLAAP